MQTIIRQEYLDKLTAFQNKKVIKIVTGVRRCGKSTILALFQDCLKKQGVLTEQIVSINLEDFDYDELRDPKKLHTYLKKHLLADKMTYIFLDEIQQCSNFPRVIDSLYIRNGVDIYITGSNANLLSSEIATLISGRYVEIKMLPLSFKEYALAAKKTTELSRGYAEYLESSSFPGAMDFRQQPKELRDYLEGIYNTIVVKDIASRKKIADAMMLESVTKFVMDNIGSPLSSKKIADTMTANGRKIDVKTVEKYLVALTESFIVYQAKRYDIRGRQYLKTLQKYYVIDIGMRYMLLGSRATDVGHILENVVYLELLRRGNDVYVGKIDNLEVDFVTVEPKKIVYYQVAATVRDESTLQRELAPLRTIKDHYPKIILTLDDDPEADYDGIRRINALNWLMGTVK
ncbi:MAG: ATP-binding protein [Faecalibacterium sp.]|jgi:predicted AAA+ superfamily ATPase|nr:ATP-binding protein [Faecalibacterium sp.]